jgi:hypothetical protein
MAVGTTRTLRPPADTQTKQTLTPDEALRLLTSLEGGKCESVSPPRRVAKTHTAAEHSLRLLNGLEASMSLSPNKTWRDPCDEPHVTHATSPQQAPRDDELAPRDPCDEPTAHEEEETIETVLHASSPVQADEECTQEDASAFCMGQSPQFVKALANDAGSFDITEWDRIQRDRKQEWGQNKIAVSKQEQTPQKIAATYEAPAAATLVSEEDRKRWAAQEIELLMGGGGKQNTTVKSAIKPLPLLLSGNTDNKSEKEGLLRRRIHRGPNRRPSGVAEDGLRMIAGLEIDNATEGGLWLDRLDAKVTFLVTNYVDLLFGFGRTRAADSGAAKGPADADREDEEFDAAGKDEGESSCFLDRLDAHVTNYVRSCLGQTTSESLISTTGRGLANIAALAAGVIAGKEGEDSESDPPLQTLALVPAVIAMLVSVPVLYLGYTTPMLFRALDPVFSTGLATSAKAATAAFSALHILPGADAALPFERRRPPGRCGMRLSSLSSCDLPARRQLTELDWHTPKWHDARIETLRGLVFRPEGSTGTRPAFVAVGNDTAHSMAPKLGFAGEGGSVGEQSGFGVEAQVRGVQEGMGCSGAVSSMETGNGLCDTSNIRLLKLVAKAALIDAGRAKSRYLSRLKCSGIVCRDDFHAKPPSGGPST